RVWLKPTVGSLSKGWTWRGCCGKRGFWVPALVGAGSQMPPWAHRGAPCRTRQAGTGRNLWWLTAGSRRRKPAPPAGMSRTSGGTKNGNAAAVRSRTNVMTTPRSTSHVTRTLLASSAQLGPPSSVEPTVRPGLGRLVAVKRGRDAAARLPNNPETGCESRDHYRSLTRNGKLIQNYDRRKGAMCWQCDNPDRTMEDYFDEVRETIRKHGWMVQYVESDRTPFAN